ncbi:hypothetical protein Lal_00028336 [Lupinus albus]|nr:hypothetical protein Lal_00028336 [Lupinus albus]
MARENDSWVQEQEKMRQEKEEFRLCLEPNKGHFPQWVEGRDKGRGDVYELETLPEVIEKAILIEQKNVIVEKRSTEEYATTAGPYRSNTYNRIVSLDSSTTSNNKRKGSFGGSVAGASRTIQEAESSKSMGEYRRLTSTEMKKKSMCFRCHEPFTRDRICKNKQLRMIILDGEEKVEKEGEAEEYMEIFNSLQLSLYSIKGLTSTKSWKIGGTL